jgi:hypothetical protein
MNGVKPTLDNLERAPLLGAERVGCREAVGLPNFQRRLESLEACDVALAVNHTNFAFVRSEVNAASSRHDSPDPLNTPLTLSFGAGVPAAAASNEAVWGRAMTCGGWIAQGLSNLRSVGRSRANDG